MTSPSLLPSLLAGDRAPAPRTLVDIFMGVVEAHPDAPAVDSGQEMLTYAELAEAASALAEQLADLGIGPGDKVGVRIRSGDLRATGARPLTAPVVHPGGPCSRAAGLRGSAAGGLTPQRAGARSIRMWACALS
ncbi:AMP-binding protein [Janibacter anophelis]|uniref:AMP-binding protein n=1 Tax=Janibacter anophelis TaxID=319054 RepID=UPI003F805FF0